MSIPRFVWLSVVLSLAILLGGWWWLRNSQDAFAPSAPESAPSAVSAPKPAIESIPEKPHETVIQAVTESGIAVRIVRPAAVVRPRPPYGVRFAALSPLAEGGDPAAQYELGLVLYECRDVPEDAASNESQIEKVQQTHKRGTWDVADPAAEAAEMRRRQADCEGVPAASRDRYRDWIRKAADAGLMQAQLDMMYHLPQREYCQYLYQCTPEQRRVQSDLQAESVRYVSLARDAGSASALWTFAAWYQSDEVLPTNDIEAYAHYRALDQIQKAAGVERRVLPMIAALERKLRPIDRTQAEARSREILSNPRCCVITP